VTTVGCSSTPWVDEADNQVANVLASAERTALEDRADWIKQPEAAVPEELAETDSGGAAQDKPAELGPQPLLISLESALLAAFSSAREYITAEENLYLSGLSLTGTRFGFGPQLDSSLNTGWADSENGSGSSSAGADFRISQLLRTGGTVSASADFGTNWNGSPGASRSWTTGVDFSLTQPLARGAGEAVAYESLTQAERSILYATRDFELFRQDHAIGIIAQYFDLIRDKTQLSNDERNFDQAVFDREKSEALRSVDRAKDEDVFLARRREVDAETRLLVARTDFDFSLDAFRIRLGLPEASAITIGEEYPPFETVALDAESAVEVALHNRLDLQTSREQVEDTRRQLRIAKNRLLPDVDLAVGYGRGDTSRELGRLGPTEWNSSAALRVEIPLQRLPERNAYRSTMISNDRAQRNFELLLENTERDVRNSLRELSRLEKQIALAGLQITQDDRAVVVTQIRYEAGEADNRDLLDARQSLINARNGLIQVQVSHYIGRLRLYRDLGLLFIEHDGSWRL
jgi:outer membrane protein TolC